MIEIKSIRISLVAARVNAGLKQREMVEMMGVDTGTIHNWENAKSEPTASQLRKISEISGIPMDFLFIPSKS